MRMLRGCLITLVILAVLVVIGLTALSQLSATFADQMDRWRDQIVRVWDDVRDTDVPSIQRESGTEG